MNLYHPGSTGRLTFKLSSFAEEEVKQTSTAGFGTIVDIEDIFEPTKKYTSSIEIIGGDLPFFETNEYTQEEITLAKQLRTLKLKELKNKNNASTTQINTGFGQGSTVSIVETQTKPIVNPEELPDFD